MPNESNNGSKANPQREWTLMFHLASDNPLAPGIVSQLKAIKNAGYHPDVNVIAQFDPHTQGVPVHIFDVNVVNKLRPEPDNIKIGIGSDPYVRNLVLDKLWGDSEHDQQLRQSIRKYLNEEAKPLEDNGGMETAVRPKKNSGAFKARVRKNSTNGKSENQDSEQSQGPGDQYDPPAPRAEMSGEMTPEDALRTFLDFCREKYPAKHYVLFILGHGVVVGNDLFLYDEDAREHSLTLKKLGSVLGDFTRKLPTGETFELIGFHSCSMSSLEVAYELRGTAKYMIASQSPAFVGSWPYTPIVLRILKDVKFAKEANPPKGETEATIRAKCSRIFSYCVYNSYDFLLAGYSFNLTLCDLTNAWTVTEPLKKLSALLTECLDDQRAKQLILLAHWEAQSFWHESYTDLYDFCSVLRRNCEAALPQSPSDALDRLGKACEQVMGKLERRTRENPDRPVMRSQCVGPVGQYSNGFSVYFPWSSPGPGEFWSKEYPDYVFEETGWRKFLNAYFEKTRRATSQVESREANRPVLEPKEGSELDLLDRISVMVFDETGQLQKGSPTDATGNEPPKGSPTDPTGIGCTCGSIKNYPSFTIDRQEKVPSVEEREQGAKPYAKNAQAAGTRAKYRVRNPRTQKKRR